MTSEVQRPDLSSLEDLVKLWGLPTTEQRVAKRVSTSIEEIQKFYDAMLPALKSIIEYLNQFPLSAIPDADRPLANATLALCEIDNSVSKWKSSTLEAGIDTRRMIEKSGPYERVL
jgi:hypothetical protein